MAEGTARRTLSQREQSRTPHPEDLRLTVTVSPQLWDAIVRLAAEAGRTPSEVFVQSIALYDATVRALREGRHVGIADSPDGLIEEVTGILAASGSD